MKKLKPVRYRKRYDGQKEPVYRSEDGTYEYTHGADIYGTGPILVNVLDKLPDNRVLVALKRLRKMVSNPTTTFRAVDSTAMGDKYTECDWGLCCNRPEVYPDKQDWIWPEDRHGIRGKVEPVDVPVGACPFDRRRNPKEITGCFYTCAFRKVFDRPAQWPKQSRAYALKMIDERIVEYERRVKDVAHRRKSVS